MNAILSFHSFTDIAAYILIIKCPRFFNFWNLVIQLLNCQYFSHFDYEWVQPSEFVCTVVWIQWNINIIKLFPPWCPPLAPCTAPNPLQNRHTGSGLYSQHRPGLFRWRLHSSDCSPWTNQPAYSDAWWSCDPSNTNKIGRTEFPYIRTCLGKPTHQPLRTIEEWTYLLTYFAVATIEQISGLFMQS